MRHEISRAGPRRQPPTDLVALVTAWSRGAPLAPAAVVRSVRRAYEVTTPTGRCSPRSPTTGWRCWTARRCVRPFREIEVERKEGDRGLLDRLGAALVGAGAVEGAFTPKHVRALGAGRRAPTPTS